MTAQYFVRGRADSIYLAPTTTTTARATVRSLRVSFSAAPRPLFCNTPLSRGILRKIPPLETHIVGTVFKTKRNIECPRVKQIPQILSAGPGDIPKASNFISRTAFDILPAILNRNLKDRKSRGNLAQCIRGYL